MLLIDSNVFLELELEQEKWQECFELINQLTTGSINGIMTDFSLYSIILIMQKHGKKPKDLKLFLENISAMKGLTIYIVSFEEKINTTKIMEKYKLDFDDALNVQAMNSNNIKEIVSFDSDFDKVKEIKRINPKEAVKNEN